jgi:diguanylate cyclase (GGDEF)-like protein/PAS domain S-box-containing protein
VTSAAPIIRVLLTEDVAADAELEVRELKRAGLRVSHRIVDSEDSFTVALREFSPDIILSDFSMPGFDGMAALALAREASPDTPFVFVSGTIGEEYAIRALKNGATDYVLKSNLVRLPAAVERALADARERRERRRAEAELEIARERLTSIFTSLPDMLWSVDAQTNQIIYVSPAAQELYGYSPEDFLHDDRLRITSVHEEDRARVVAAWKKLKDGEPFDIDYRAQRPDGSVRWINNRGRLVRDRQGLAERYDGLARDVTEQVEHRHRIARLSRIRDLTSSINVALVRERERQRLAAEVCRIVVEVGRFNGAQIGMVDAATQEVGWLAARSAANAPLESIRSSSLAGTPAGEGIAGRSLRSGEPMVWNDIAQEADEYRRTVLAGQGTRSAASLPLLIEGKAVGVLILHAAEKGFFDRDEIRLLTELAANVSFALELIAKQERIAYLALYDALTGLPNRSLLHDRLAHALEAAGRRGEALALVIMDLERFKALNDAFGQQVGDRALQALAERLRQTAGELHHAARLGSNVFALMLPSISDAQEVARRFEAGLLFGAPFDVDGRDVQLAAKTGIAVYPADGMDADALIRNAEAALKRAKETGERYLFYAPNINARVSEQVELEHRLRKAVERGELFLHFQPKLDLVTRRIVGLEALMRWQAPEGGLVSPAKFVPVLEQTGLILEAGRQAIAKASAAYREWQARGLTPPRVAVNVSALQLRRRSFAADIRGALGEEAGDGGGLDLEITESLLMNEIDESIRKLREVRAMGISIALDDFGTGYSSLAYLSKLPIDLLKIDRGFVRGMTENPDDTSIISIIISLAQALRLKVVAEGVESEQQAQLLRLLRCDQMQGYLFSPPVPAERIEAMLRAA